MTGQRGQEAESATLEALVAQSAGKTVRLEGAHSLDRPLRLGHGAVLAGPRDDPAVIWLDTPSAQLILAGDGCGLSDVVVAARGFHGGPLVHVERAHRVNLVRLGLVGAQGTGLFAGECEGLVLDAVSALAIGGEALVLERCRDLRVVATCCTVARSRRAPAVLLRNCTGARVGVAAREVGGGAVTVEVQEPGRLDTTLDVSAVDCVRGVSVLGAAASPATGLSLSVRAVGVTDCAVLLANVTDAVVDVAFSGGEGVPALRLAGGAGVHGCEITLAEDQQPGDIGDNRLQRRAHDPSGLPGASTGDVPAAVRAAFAARGERRFAAYEVAGRCRVCGAEGRFRCTHPAERESLGCPGCGATLRYRGQAGVLADLACERLPSLGPEPSLAEAAAAGAFDAMAIFEPGTAGPLRPYLRRAALYRQSVYEQGAASGTPGADGVEHQDLMALSYPDSHFDLVVTSDIFEHVRKPFAAFSEVHRVLRPGGVHVFTVPFNLPLPQRTTPRVDTSGPEDRFLLPPVYHGSGRGGASLVYTDFGRDLGRRLADMGFAVRAVRHAGRSAEAIVGVTLVATRVA